MRFSDMMGSGEERSRKPSENDNAVSDALAPYLDAVAPPRRRPPPAPPVETARRRDRAREARSRRHRARRRCRTAAAAAAPLLTPQPLRCRRDERTVGSVFPVVVAPYPPTNEPRRRSADLADFTPLSDDLLPRRRARA